MRRLGLGMVAALVILTLFGAAELVFGFETLSEPEGAQGDL